MRRQWVRLVALGATLLVLAVMPENAMMNNDPGMCDILCGSDPICYDNCLYGGGGGAGGVDTEAGALAATIACKTANTPTT